MYMNTVLKTITRTEKYGQRKNERETDRKVPVNSLFIWFQHYTFTFYGAHLLAIFSRALI